MKLWYFGFTSAWYPNSRDFYIWLPGDVSPWYWLGQKPFWRPGSLLRKVVDAVVKGNLWMVILGRCMYTYIYAIYIYLHITISIDKCSDWLPRSFHVDTVDTWHQLSERWNPKNGMIHSWVDFVSFSSSARIKYCILYTSNKLIGPESIGDDSWRFWFTRTCSPAFTRKPQIFHWKDCGFSSVEWFIMWVNG